jgi:signal peptidase
MKRAIGLIFATIACVVAFLSVRGTLPFMPIFGTSMEPTLHSGGLLMIEPVNPQDIKVGDIIVYNVPSAVRSYYNYPPTVSHRVIQVYTVPSLGFRTKGDNTGEDPFTVRPQDIRGTVGSQIPYLGLPLLFFQSQQGMIFAIVAIALLALFLYGGELGRGGGWVHRGIFSPVINEEKRSNRMLSRKIDATEKKMNSTEQALDKFSAAVAEYAKHLASHTGAIQGLSEASHELTKGAAEQNRVLAAIMDNLSKVGQKQETVVYRTEAPPPPRQSEPETKKQPYVVVKHHYDKDVKTEVVVKHYHQGLKTEAPPHAPPKQEPQAETQPEAAVKSYHHMYLKTETSPPAPLKQEPQAKNQPEAAAKPYHKALTKAGTLGCARKTPVTPDELGNTHR